MRLFLVLSRCGPSGRHLLSFHVLSFQSVCGFHYGTWSIDTIPPENFAQGDKLNADAAHFADVASPPVASWLAVTGRSPTDAALATMQLPTVGLPTLDINIVRGTREYVEEKIRLLGLVIEHQRDVDKVVSPIEKGLIQTVWYEPPKKKTYKLSHIWGEFLAKDLMLTMKEIDDAEKEEERKRLEKKGDLRVLYDAFKDGCSCEGSVCLASGIYVCFTCEPAHGNIRRGLCQKGICKKARLVCPPLVPRCQRRLRYEGQGPWEDLRPLSVLGVRRLLWKNRNLKRKKRVKRIVSMMANRNRLNLMMMLIVSWMSRQWRVLMLHTAMWWVVDTRCFGRKGPEKACPPLGLLALAWPRRIRMVFGWNTTMTELAVSLSPCSLHDHRSDWQIVSLGSYGDRGNNEESDDGDIPLASRKVGAK